PGVAVEMRNPIFEMRGVALLAPSALAAAGGGANCRHPDGTVAVGKNFRMVSVTRQSFAYRRRRLLPLAAHHAAHAHLAIIAERHAGAGLAEPVAVVLAPVRLAFFPCDPEASAGVDGQSRARFHARRCGHRHLGAGYAATHLREEHIVVAVFVAVV